MADNSTNPIPFFWPAAAPAPPTPTPACARCGAAPTGLASSNFAPCLQCHTAHYCSRDCQNAHLVAHQPQCQAIVAERVDKVLRDSQNDPSDAGTLRLTDLQLMASLQDIEAGRLNLLAQQREAEAELRLFEVLLAERLESIPPEARESARESLREYQARLDAGLDDLGLD